MILNLFFKINNLKYLETLVFCQLGGHLLRITIIHLLHQRQHVHHPKGITQHVFGRHQDGYARPQCVKHFVRAIDEVKFNEGDVWI